MIKDIKQVNERLMAIFEKHGICDKKEQQQMLIEIINAFTGR